MPSESFKKFIEQFSAARKDETDLSAYEKFGTKPKQQRRAEVREHRANTRHSPAVLDLHGQTVAKAEQQVTNFIANHAGEVIVVITGRSGKLRQLFPEWADGFLQDKIVEYKLMQTKGSWEVRVRNYKFCP